MVKLYIASLIGLLLICNIVLGQTLALPKIVPDGEVTKLDYNPQLGLLMAGNFSYVGFPAQNIGIVNNSDGAPSGVLPYLNSNNDGNLYRQAIIPDGTNGWYVLLRSGYGQPYQQRPQYNSWDSTNTARVIDHVIHILPNNAIDTLFKITPTANYRISGIHNLVLYKDVLYGWCDLTDTQGNITSRKLLGLDARTGAVVWDPNTFHRTDRYTGGVVVVGRNLFAVGFIINVNGQPSIRNSISYNLDSRTVRQWTPLSTYNFNTCNGCEPTKISANRSSVFINVTLPNNFCTNADVVAADTLTGNRLWTKNYQCIYQASTIEANDTVAYGFFYNSGVVSSHYIRKYNASDGTLLAEIPYPTGLDPERQNNPIYVGDINGMKLSGKNLYLYGQYGNLTTRRGVVQIDITNFRVTDWKPFGERESIDASSSNTRSIVALAEQNSKVFIAGDFKLLKPKYANGVAVVNPLTNTLLFRPVFTDVQGQLQNPSAISFDGDSLIWTVHFNRFRGFDAHTGLLIYNFDLSGPYSPSISQLIPSSDKLYLRGSFSGIQGQPASPPGFGVINREGAPYAWPPAFPTNLGQTNNIQIVGDQLWIGGSFTSNDGKSGLAILDKNTGQPNSWPSLLTSNQSVNNFLVTERDVFVDRFTGNTRFALLNTNTGKIDRELSNSALECSTLKKMVSREKYIFVSSDCYTANYDPIITYYDREYTKFFNGSILRGYNLTVNNTPVYAPAPKTNDMVFVGDKLYHGTMSSTFYYSGSGGSLPIPPLTFTLFPAEFFNNKIEYFPHAGNNAAQTTVNFYGYTIVPGSKVRLLLNGQTPITSPDSSISFPEQFRMQVIFNLRGKTTGDWDVEITLPSNEVVLIPKGFKINPVKPDDIRASIIAPSATRVGAPTPILISVANRGDADVFDVPLWIVFSPNATVRMPIIKRKNDSTYQVDSIPGFLPIRPPGGGSGGSSGGSGGGSGNDNGSWVVIPKIPGGETSNIPVTVTPNTQTPVTVRAYPGPPLMRPNSEINPSDYDTYGLVPFAFGCAADAFKKALDAFKGVAGALGLVEANAFKDFLEAAYKYSQSGNSADLAYDAGKAALDILKDSAPEGNISDLADHLSKALGALDAIEGVGGLLTPPETDNCDKFKPDPKHPSAVDMPAVSIRSFGGIDPNDKLGPVGVKSQRYVNSNSLFSYLIRFENKDVATADVQNIRILDTLDREKFEFSSFQLGYFNLADTTFYVPPGKKHHIVDWDLRPGKNLILRMEARFDEVTGILKATYIGLDPKTMEQTSEILLGFLPPNQHPPQGEGGIAYSIQLKEEIANGATVKNEAAIYFDYNAPIPTPVWTNTVDKKFPDSHILTIPTISSDTAVTLRWTGTDNESGVKFYKIYVSKNGGSYQQLLTFLSDSTTYRFIGEPNSVYRFYSIAIDSVGNEEPIPQTFDAETTIGLTNIIESVSSGNWNATSSWSCGCIPTASDTVLIGHFISVPEDTNIQIGKIMYKLGGQLRINRRANIKFPE